MPDSPPARAPAARQRHVQTQCRRRRSTWHRPRSVVAGEADALPIPGDGASVGARTRLNSAATRRGTVRKEAPCKSSLTCSSMVAAKKRSSSTGVRWAPKCKCSCASRGRKPRPGHPGIVRQLDEIRVGDGIGDGGDHLQRRCRGRRRCHGFSLSVTMPTVEDADQRVRRHAEAGRRGDDAARQTFWSQRLGMLADRFGVGLIVKHRPLIWFIRWSIIGAIEGFAEADF